MKKIISLAIVCVMMLGMLSMVSFAEDKVFDLGNGFKGTISGTVLTVTGEGELEYAGYTGNDFSTWPWHVEACGDSGCDAACPAQTVTKVVVADGVTGIKTSRIFQNFDTMTEIEFGKDCVAIPADCFSGCATLKKVTFNATMTSIGQGVAFGTTSIESIVLTNQTKDEFKTIAMEKPYNFKDNGGFETGLDVATYTTKTASDNTPDTDDTPATGDATVVAVVFATVAILGMAVVVTKKVNA